MSSQSNILWLSLESVRADHTPIYGYERHTTPFLQQLSDYPETTVLDPMIAASRWTAPSSASILTGTHMSTHQVGQDGKGNRSLPSKIKTLPELLSDIGYQTALFSPNSFLSGGDTGLGRGFNHVEELGIRKENFIGLDSLTRDSLKLAFRRFIEYPTLSLQTFKHQLGNSANCLVKYRVRRWLEEQYLQDNPFFMYAHIQSPHHGYHPIAKFRDQYSEEIELNTAEAGRLTQLIYEGAQSINRRIATGLEISDREWEAITAMYDSEIRYADYTVKKIVNMVRKAADGPLITIVVGDHGDLFGEYDLIGHDLVLHDGLIQVPGLVVGIDDVVDTEETVTQHIDLSYTIAKLAGVLTDQFEGRDIRESSREYSISQRGVAHLDRYTQYDDGFETSRFFEAPFTSVRTMEWKLLTNNNRDILYHLPDEKVDVSAQYPEVVDDLKGVIEQENISWERLQGEEISYDEETTSRLRNLGYLT